MSRKRFSRPRKIREIGAKVIIVCEGETEEIYFEAIRKSKRLQTLKIRVVNPDYTDPEHIVRYAIELRKAAEKEKNWLPDDEAWAVYDGDEHKNANINNWHSAINLATDKNIKLGISNPSFELWYLLHYQNQSAAIDRHKTFAKVKTHISSYEKTKDFYESHFKSRTNLASTRAEKLSQIIERDDLDLFHNPSTKIYLLVRKLSEL